MNDYPDEDGDPIRGLFHAIPIALAMWACLILGIYAIYALVG